MAYPFDARSVTTDDLIARYQRGQAAAFSALFDRYKDYVYRLALMHAAQQQRRGGGRAGNFSGSAARPAPLRCGGPGPL